MDIATLGLAIDSRPAATAAENLDKMAAAGARMEQQVTRAANNASAAMRQGASSHVDAYRAQQGAAERYLQTLRDEVATYGKSRASIEAYRAAQAGLTAEQQRSAVAMGQQLDVMKANTAQMGAMQQAAVGLGAVMAGAFVARQIFEVSKALFDASANAERLRTTLDFASGGNGAAEMDYVRKIANQLGLELNSTAKAYASFAAGARGTAIEGEGARKVFEAVSKASAVMGLSADQSSGALLALQQMISKGTVQAEELRGQLGERLPGAFQIAARAMGVTTEELGKMLEKGLVPAADFLPKFAAQLENELGGAAEKAAGRLDASVNRFNTAWEELKRSIGDAGVARGFANTADAAATGITNLYQSIDRMTASKSWSQFFYAAIDTTERFEERITDARKALRDADADLAKSPNNIYFRSAAAEARAYVAELEAVKRAQSGAGIPNANMNAGVEASGRAREAYENARKAEQKERDAYYEKDIRQTKEQRRIEDITKANAANAALVEKALGNENELVKLRVALETEIANISEKYKDKSGASAMAASVRDGVNAQIEEYKRGQVTQEEISRRTVGALTAMRASGAITEIQYIQQVATEELKRAASAETALQMEIAAAGKKKNNATQVAQLEGQLAVAREKRLTREQELNNDLAAVEARRAAASNALHNAAINSELQELAQMEASNRRLREEIELIGLDEKAIQRVTEARIDSTIARQREKIAIMETMDVLGQSADAIDIERRKLEELETSRRLYSQKTTQERSFKEYKAQNDEFWSSVESTAQKVWTDVSEHGVSAFERVGKTIKATVLDMLWQITAKRWIVGIQGVLTGQQGATQGLMGGGNSGSGIASDGLGLIGSGIQAWGGYSVGASAASLGAANAVGLAGGDALGALIAGNGAWAGVGTGAAASGVGALGGALSAVGSALPYIGAALAVLSFISSMDGSGDMHRGGTAAWSAAAGSRSSVSGLDNIDNQFRTGMGYVEDDTATRGAVGTIATTVGLTLDTLSRTFGGKGLFDIATGWADDGDGEGDSWGALRISQGDKDLVNWNNDRANKWGPRMFSAGEDGYKEYLAAIAQDTRSVLLEMDLPSWATEIFENIGDSGTMEDISAAVQRVAKVQAIYDQLTDTIVNFADITSESFGALMKIMGGEDAMSAQVGGYYQNFYTEEERRAKLTEQLTREFEKQNLTLPQTREGYRELAEAQDLNTEEGRKNYAVLMRLSEAFASIVPAAEAAATAIDDSAKKLEEIAKTRRDLEDRLLSLQGNSAELLARQRERERATIVALDPALGALIDQIYALEDAANATAAATRAREAAMSALSAAAAEQSRVWREEADAVRLRRDAASEALALVSNVFSLVGSSAREMYGEIASISAMQSAQGKAFIERALLAARATGYLPDASQLDDAITSARSGLDIKNYASQNELDFDTMVIAGRLRGLEDISGKQKTALELQVEYQDEQLQRLADLQTQQDKVLDYWRKQIEIASGANEIAMSVSDAIAAIVKILTPEQPGASAGSGGSPFVIGGGGGGDGGGSVNLGEMQDERIRHYVGAIYGDSTDYADPRALNNIRTVAQMEGWTQAKLGVALGIPVADLEALFGGAGIPSFDVGTNRVPRDMLAFVHKDEAIVPKQYNPAMGRTTGQAPIETAFAAANNTLIAVCEDINTNTQRTADILDQWTMNGQGEARVIARMEA